MRKIRLRLAYDGTDFCGWQTQTNGDSIQASVETAILHVTGTASSVTAAGRTDAGVHAVGQVAHFETSSMLPSDSLRKALQSQLPPAVVVLAADEVDPRFHARYHAKWKRYRYVIDNSLVPLPFLAGKVYHYRRLLDAAAMHAAGQCLVGKHDFRCFESRWPNRDTSVRTISELTVTRQPGWGVWHQPDKLSQPAVSNGEFICIDVVADGFLYNMVRSIVGTLIEVGRGRWDAADVCRILEGQLRDAAGPTAPPQGLYLIHVAYD